MFLLIDKPRGITSHDVIDEVRNVTGEKRVGHAGTLDPNATGLLIVGVGRESTKKLGEIAGKRKTYEAEIVLGVERTTDDVEGEIVNRSRNQVGASHRAKSERDDKTAMKSIPVLSNIESALESFTGEQEQVPPVYSAIKLKGRKAYELARRGKKPELQPRKVHIYSIELLSYKFPKLEIRTDVSSGTYIRALTRDIGRELGTGAYLNNLNRTKIGNFSVDDAVKLKELNDNNWKNYLINI